MIRAMTADDLPFALSVAGPFFAASPWGQRGVEMDLAAIEAMVLRCIEGGGAFRGEGGLIIGLLAPVWLNPSLQSAHELAWWGAGEGVALREAFEAWAKDQGAVGVHMSTLGAAHDGKTEAHLAGAGYARAGQEWFKGV